jgi:hypothetical protein
MALLQPTEADKATSEMNGKQEALHAEKGQDGIVTAKDPAVPDGEAESPSCMMPYGKAIQNRPEQDGYYGAPFPTNEKERHETLCACQVLDSAPDPRFDDITKLVRLE